MGGLVCEEVIFSGWMRIKYSPCSTAFQKKNYTADELPKKRDTVTESQSISRRLARGGAFGNRDRSSRRRPFMSGYYRGVKSLRWEGCQRRTIWDGRGRKMLEGLTPMIPSSIWHITALGLGPEEKG